LEDKAGLSIFQDLSQVKQAFNQPWLRNESVNAISHAPARAGYFASMDKMAFSLPDKPFIAVLPFVNMTRLINPKATIASNFFTPPSQCS
jgi:hypothetical protein